MVFFSIGFVLINIKFLAFVTSVLCLANRFVAGVVHSFTGSAEERDQLLAIPNLYIGTHPLLKIGQL